MRQILGNLVIGVEFVPVTDDNHPAQHLGKESTCLQIIHSHHFFSNFIRIDIISVINA